MLVLAMMLAAQAPETPFPEQVPVLMERCIEAAIAADDATETEDSHKYMCSDESAEHLWAFLERARIPSWTQDTENEGQWLSRGFPLGACFKRLRTPEGRPTTEGLSCSIWIPRPIATPQS